MDKLFPWKNIARMTRKSTLMIAFVFVATVVLQVHGSTIEEYVGGNAAIGGFTFLAQPFLTPDGGPWDHVTFSFLDLTEQGHIAVAAGAAYLFSSPVLYKSPFTGTPLDLKSTNDLATSTEVSDGRYVFRPSFTLLPNTLYFLYTDQDLISFPNDGGVELGPNGFRYEASLFSQFEPADGATNFRLSGDVVNAIPEPSAISLIAIGIVLGILRLVESWMEDTKEPRFPTIQSPKRGN